MARRGWRRADDVLNTRSLAEPAAAAPPAPRSGLSVPRCDRPQGFVALTSLKQRRGRRSGSQALAEIRRIYFKTTTRTIDHDFAHAIELLKGLETEDDAREGLGLHGRAGRAAEGVGRRNRPSAARQAARSRAGRAQEAVTTLLVRSTILRRAVIAQHVRHVAVGRQHACRSFSFSRASRFIDSATGVLGFFTSGQRRPSSSSATRGCWRSSAARLPRRCCIFAMLGHLGLGHLRAAEHGRR